MNNAKKKKEVAKILFKTETKFDDMFLYYSKIGVSFKDMLTKTQDFDTDFSKRITAYAKYLTEDLIPKFKTMCKNFQVKVNQLRTKQGTFGKVKLKFNPNINRKF